MKNLNDSLLTKDFCCLTAANFLLFFSFYAIMPLLPFYLIERYSTPQAIVGIVLSTYSVACIIIRPITGYLIDSFQRRPIYIAAYFLFMAIFCGYAAAGILSLFILLRTIHGIAFGMTTVSGNTIVVDIVPSTRQGEALGYYGVANTLSMCIGPMFGLYLKDYVSYEKIFAGVSLISLLGWILAIQIKTTVCARKKAARTPISWNQLFINKGIKPACSLMLASVPYGMTTAYIAVYAEDMRLACNAGLFYTFMAVGLGLSRLLSGKFADRGNLKILITSGLIMVAVSFFLLSSIKSIAIHHPNASIPVYLFTALLQGIAYGTLHPAFNVLFVRMASEKQRGAATSMYQTSWDLGIGIGIFAGSGISEWLGDFSTAYFYGALLASISILVFRSKYGKMSRN